MLDTIGVPLKRLDRVVEQINLMCERSPVPGQSRQERREKADLFAYNWAVTPLTALGGKTALQCLGTDEGLEQVLLLLQQIEYGVYV